MNAYGLGHEELQWLALNSANTHQVGNEDSQLFEQQVL
jgi:hypothetical protein